MDNLDSGRNEMRKTFYGQFQIIKKTPGDSGSPLPKYHKFERIS
jgi:hypothetical protein